MQRTKSFREKARRWLVSFWTEYKWCILSGMIIGLIAYMFTFTNKLPNHDDVLYMFGKGATVTSGRWGLELLRCILPNFSMPWIYGLITLACISASAGLIAYAFCIRSRLAQVLLGGLFIVFPALIGTFSYMFTSSSFGVAFLLATLAFVLVSRERNPVRNAALGTLLMILSLSIYQAYISLTVSLLVIYLIQKLVKTDASAKEIMLTGIRYICFALAALILYFAITKLILAILSIGFNTYASDSFAGLSDGILKRLRHVLTKPISILVKGSYGYIPDMFSRICHTLCLLLTLILAVRWFFKRETGGRRWLMPLLLLAFLFSLNMLFFIIDSSNIHTLVLYGYASIYVLFIVLIDADERIVNSQRIAKAIQRIVCVLMIGILIHNVYLANEASLLEYINYQNQFAEFSGLLTRIESMPEYQPGTKIAIIGYGDPTDPDISDSFPNTKKIKGLNMLRYSREEFMHLYLGYEGEFASAEEKAALQETAEFAEMQTYPYYDSIRVIDGYIVVKF